ncbi:MAG: hypothetical protein LKK00_08255 [Intestinimonas sp.]|jgi:hypothetical protein|nr:hypothetical protein [Intestinimonas sp.]
MPEIMNVSNPVPGYDNAAGSRSIPNAANDPSIQNVPNPARVNRPDSKAAQQQDAGSQSRPAPLRYDSNFQAFLQRMQNSETSVVEMTRFLREGLQYVVSSGLKAGTAADLSPFLEMLHMSEGQFLQFLSDQVASGNRFYGPIFDLLRNTYFSSDSPGMHGDILQFLKQYSDWSSTGHIEDNLLRALNRATMSMPKSWGGKVVEFSSALQNGIAAGDRAGNLKLLQGQILPYLSDYVSRSHDMGRVRSALTMLMLDVARYENGSEEGVVQAFHQLLSHASLREKLGDLSDEALLNLLRNSAYEKASRNNTFADHLAASADRAFRGSTGAESQDVFHSLVSSLLVNESVYMTVNHYLIPLVWNGRMMFSELWVDPDAEQDGHQPHEDDRNRTLRFLFKADIQSLGLFDIVLTCRGTSVDLNVRCPERVAPFSDVIQNSLSGILTDNGLDVGSVQVEKMNQPLTVSEIFPKIFNGRDSINVKA